ncbi:Bgt-50143 [Blumeria graminis f. sp. tritici]|uniref:Bgt-50143 n=1 Tax=Blumeria graminis f. sp. tritici TaxID=62690 RepID=A0A9X9PSK7_BLUGR|nr:Bgt-50143 [Blumeria graminis f. sp. tritici]
MPGSRCKLLSPYLRGGITSHQRTEDLQELNERARAKALHSK